VVGDLVEVFDEADVVGHDVALVAEGLQSADNADVLSFPAAETKVVRYDVGDMMSGGMMSEVCKRVERQKRVVG
jgi:hypothetical protein